MKSNRGHLQVMMLFQLNKFMNVWMYRSSLHYFWPLFNRPEFFTVKVPVKDYILKFGESQPRFCFGDTLRLLGFWNGVPNSEFFFNKHFGKENAINIHLVLSNFMPFALKRKNQTKTVLGDCSAQKPLIKIWVLKIVWNWPHLRVQLYFCLDYPLIYPNKLNPFIEHIPLL